VKEDLDYVVANCMARGIDRTASNPQIASRMTELAIHSERVDELQNEITVNLERLQCMRRQPRNEAPDKLYNKWLVSSGRKHDKILKQREKQVTPCLGSVVAC
jgi:hypothetical protein